MSNSAITGLKFNTVTGWLADLAIFTILFSISFFLAYFAVVDIWLITILTPYDYVRSSIFWAPILIPTVWPTTYLSSRAARAFLGWEARQRTRLALETGFWRRLRVRAMLIAPPAAFCAPCLFMFFWSEPVYGYFWLILPLFCFLVSYFYKRKPSWFTNDTRETLLLAAVVLFVTAAVIGTRFAHNDLKTTRFDYCYSLSESSVGENPAHLMLAAEKGVLLRLPQDVVEFVPWDALKYIRRVTGPIYEKSLWSWFGARGAAPSAPKKLCDGPSSQPAGPRPATRG